MVAAFLGACERGRDERAGKGSRPADEARAAEAARPLVTKPDILIWMADTVRRDHLSIYGYPRETCPRLKSLATEAVVFADAYANSSWTRPSVANLFTGRYSGVHGAVRKTDRLRAQVPTLADILGAAGYDTVGFVTNPNIHSLFGFARGFRLYQDLDKPLKAEKKRASQVVESIRGYLESSPTRPFFIYAHSVDPHGAYAPPAPYHQLFNAERAETPVEETKDTGLTPEDVQRALDAYDGEIAYNDAQFGLVIDELKQRGLFDDMLIVYVSDHGEEFQEHEWGGHGHSVFEELVRMPLVIKLPRMEAAGTVFGQRVQMIDVLPTILAAGGIVSGHPHDGVNLYPMLKRSTEELRRLLDQRLVFVDVNDGLLPWWRGVVTGRYKYIERLTQEAGMVLFDLAEDPGEKRNVLPEHVELAEELRQLVAGFDSRFASGIQVSFINGPDDKVRRYVGRYWTEGVFEAAESYQFEKDDSMELSLDRRTISFDVSTANYPNYINEWPLEILDEDVILFRTEPPAATVTLEAVGESELAPSTVRLGNGQFTLDVLPYAFSLQSAELQSRQPLIGLLHSGNEPPGCYMSARMPAARETARITSDVLEELRSLGYVD